MIRIRLILAAAALALVATATMTPTAAADNCDIFINPQDCQNTAWTIGTIATLTGGVAVAMAATMTGGRTPGPRDPPPTAPTPPPSESPPAKPPRVRRRPNGRDDDDSKIEGVEVRPTFDAPTITVHPEDRPVRAHSVRLEINRDPGTQTVQEVHRGPR
ncbi:MAG TPA: hypothetical protein VLJ59_00750 [Mycobacteriales bacterium]|nr:hypothetical protein [Mycobacteriales bacterium]